MADIIGQETWTADGKAYVIKVTEPGATVTENAISIISSVRHRQGAPNASPFEPILASQLEFTIRDNSKLFRNAIDGKEIGDIVLEFTEDGNTLFKGYVIPEYQRSLAWKSNPEFKVSAYDGISGLKGFTWDITGEKTARQLIHECADKIGLELTLNTIFETKHNGAHSSTDPIDALRNRAEHLLEEGQTYYDVLVFLCKFFGCQFFQSGGQWYFMQREQRDGTTVTNYPTNSSGAAQTNATVDYNFALTDSDLHRDTTFLSSRPATARYQSVFKYPNYLLKNTEWLEGNKYWDNNGSDSAGVTDGYRQITINNGFLTQTIGTTLLDATTLFDKIYFGFNVKVGFSGSAPGGSQSIEYCEIKAIDDDGTINYLNSSLTWQSSQVYISQTVTATASTVQTFNATLTSAKIPFTPCRIILTLYFDKDATGSLADIDYIEFGEITVLHLKPDQEDDVVRPEQFTETDTTTKLGDNSEEEFIVGDTDGNKYNGIGIFEYTTDGTTWVPTNDWNGSGQSIHALRVASLKSQLEARQEQYEFAHKFGDRPDLHNSLVYAASGGITGKIFIPTFAESIYARNAKVVTRTAAIEQLGASQEVLYLDYVWWAGEETGSTPNPDYGIYRSTVPGDVNTVPWETDTDPFDKLLITGDSAPSNQILHVAVDRIAGYIFSCGYTSKELKRHDLDGGNETTGSPAITAWNLALDRMNEHIVAYDLSAFVEYEYDLSSNRTLYTRAGSIAGCPGIDQSGTYMYLAELNVGGTTDRIRRVTLSDLTVVTLADFTALTITSLDTGRCLVDEDAELVFILLPTSASTGTIYSFTYPGGTTLTSVVAGVGYGMGLDRLNQKVIYSDASGDMWRANYNGTSPEKIYDYSASLDVRAIDLGLS